MLQTIIEDIKNEIKVNSTGQAFISKRGLARLLGISDTNFNAQQMAKKLAETLTRQGFEVLGMINGSGGVTYYLLTEEQATYLMTN